MDNQTIIDEIKSNLTHNKETDVSYLQTELIVFRTLNNDEVVAALEQLLFSYLSKEEKAEYDQKTHEILSVRYDDYQNCLELIKENKLDDASKILVRLIKTYEKIENVKTFNYYDFEQLIEYIIITKSVDNAKKLNVKRYPEPITYYCYQLALIYIKQNNLNDAKIYLEKALKFNPASMYVREELANVYLSLDLINDAKNLCEQSLKMAYSKDLLSYFYQVLGLCYYRLSQYDIALACLYASIDFKEDSDVEELIASIIDKHNTSISHQEVITLLSSKSINYGPNKTLLNACCDFIKYLKQIKDFDDLKYLCIILYELTDQEEYSQELQKVKIKEDEYNGKKK